MQPVVGVTAALLYQRFYRIKLPSYLAFFGGRRFVPIITAFASVALAVLFANVWARFSRGTSIASCTVTQRRAPS